MVCPCHDFHVLAMRKSISSTNTTVAGEWGGGIRRIVRYHNVVSSVLPSLRSIHFSYLNEKKNPLDVCPNPNFFQLLDDALKIASCKNKQKLVKEVILVNIIKNFSFN